MATITKVVLWVVVACTVVAAPYAAAFTCGDVFNKLQPCLNYLRRGGAVPGGCCDSLKGLNGMTKSTGDRKLACGCLKTALSAFAGVNQDRALGLPNKCRVQLPYKISPNADCSNNGSKQCSCNC